MPEAPACRNLFLDATALLPVSSKSLLRRSSESDLRRNGSHRGGGRQAVPGATPDGRGAGPCTGHLVSDVARRVARHVLHVVRVLRRSPGTAEPYCGAVDRAPYRSTTVNLWPPRLIFTGVGCEWAALRTRPSDSASCRRGLCRCSLSPGWTGPPGGTGLTWWSLGTSGSSSSPCGRTALGKARHESEREPGIRGAPCPRRTLPATSCSLENFSRVKERRRPKAACARKHYAQLTAQKP